LKLLLKGFVYSIFLVLAFPLALLSVFGRIEPIFVMGAQCCSLIPGLPGDYLRIAYYRLTLEECSLDSRIQFGSFFAHPQAKVGRNVYIGSYCILGRTRIGDRTQIASSVQILSGGRQHPRGPDGRILGAEHGTFETVAIGSDCWIGAAVIVMAEVGKGSTIGAGSVVVQPIPAGSVAVGSPARVIRTTSEGAA